MESQTFLKSRPNKDNKKKKNNNSDYKLELELWGEKTDPARYVLCIVYLRGVMCVIQQLDYTLVAAVTHWRCEIIKGLPS